MGRIKKGHLKAASMKTVPLPYPELCATLFDGNSATGNFRQTSSQTTSAVGSSSCNRVQPLLITSNDNHNIEDDDGTSYETTQPPPDPPSPNFDNSPNVDRPNKRAKSSTARQTPMPTPIPPPNAAPTPVPTQDKLAVDMQKALRQLVTGPTTDQCYEKLKLVALAPTDRVFLAAFHIFGLSTSMREAWMTLPDDPEVLKGWTTMTAESIGVLK